MTPDRRPANPPTPAVGPIRVRFALEPLADFIKPQYKRLALITHENHLAHLDADDEDTLIVSCDWLLWQQALNDRRHCVYYELGILDWNGPEADNTHLYVQANDWVYEDGKDLTLFHGVSLGKQFCTEMALNLMNTRRLNQSITALAARFSSQEILFFDFSNDISVLDLKARKNLVQAFSARQGVRFSDRSDVQGDVHQSLSDTPVTLKGHNLRVRVMLFVYTRLLESLTRLRCLFSRNNKRVLVVFVTNLIEPLLLNYSGEGVTPVFLTRSVPKKPGLLWRCLVKGVLLATPKNVSLTAVDHERLKEIRAAVERALDAPSSGNGEIPRDYIKRHILGSGKLTKAALGIVAAERLIDRYCPDRVVVDGERNPPTRTYIELARSRNIKTDHTWHGPLIPKNQKLDALEGDPRAPSLFNRCLTWGTAHEAWLDAIGSRKPMVRVGSPLSDRYRNAPVLRTAGNNNALVLQYTPNLMDLRGLNDNIFGNFVETVRLLQERGYKNIRFKLHPGPGRWKKSYFEKIAGNFNLRCQIFKTEPFEECVNWADIVVGPVTSGAMFETIAAGKPYYTMLIPPHSMDDSYYGDYPLLSSVDELARVLDQPLDPEAGRKLLNAVYSVNEYPSGSKRFWEVMRGEVQ